MQTNFKYHGVNIFGYLNGGFGLAMAAKYFIKSIDGKVSYALRNIENKFQISEFSGLENTDLPYPVNIYFINADEIKGIRNREAVKIKNNYEIGVWFWELEEFPEYLHSSFSVLDEIWTCSEYIYQSLKKISPIPVFLMPFPWFAPEASTQNLCSKSSDFNFLTVFDYRSDFSRKNPLAVVKSFSMAFQNTDNVSLTIKSINHQEFFKLHQLLKDEIKNDKRIKLIDDRISRDEMNKLFDKSDCFVSLHRAEGLGLNILDAASRRKPLIVTGYGGCIDFINYEYCEVVPFSKVPVTYNTEFLNVKNSYWAEPDIVSASVSMQKIFNKQNEFIIKAGKQKIYQEEKLSPSLTQEWFVKRLLAINPLRVRQKKKYNLSDSLTEVIKKSEKSKILLTGTAPSLRVKEVFDTIKNDFNFSVIDYFGRNTDLKFSSKYLYPAEGMFCLENLPIEISSEMRSKHYNIVVVLLMNYYGYKYDNIKEIVESLKPEKVIALGKENDIFFW